MPNVLAIEEWSQTENTLIIRVPLRGVHSSKVDVFYSESYIKASYEQNFFEVFLSQQIKSKESLCTITSNHILFELVKCEPQIWEKLELELSKAERQELKKRYIEEEYEKQQKEHADLKSKKSELKRLAVREQMALDAKQRAAIESKKEDEKCNALKDMGIWTQPARAKNKCKPKNKQKNEEIKELVVREALPVPPPRCNSTLNVSFTPREFPTPCRESRLEEENEWLRKQAEAQRSVGFISEDLRPEEHNPQFLYSKGNEFLKGRNYLAAISAYSFGIKLNDKFPALHVSRAEAHLALGNHNKVIQDCSRALELMTPEVPANLRERAFCIGWRGIALISLGLVTQGISELKASLTLVPNEDFSFKLNEANEELNEMKDNSQ